MKNNRMRMLLTLFFAVFLIIGILPLDVFSQSSEPADVPQTEVSSEQLTQAESGTVESEVTQSSEEAVEESEENRAAEPDVSDKVTVDEWHIRDDEGVPLSETNIAISDKNYTFDFTWSLQLDGGQTLQENDYFTIEAPKNEGIEGVVAAWGSWIIIGGSGWHVLKTTEGKEIGRWQANYNEQGVSQIQVIFNEKVNGMNLSHIPKVNFTLSKNGIKNNSLKGGTQGVTFGGITQLISFEQRHVELNSGWDFKYHSSAGEDQVDFHIAVNTAGANELSGDEFDYNANEDTGFSYELAGLKFNCGEHFTNVTGAYVEDELDSGAKVAALTISAQMRIPVVVNMDALAGKKGAIPSQDSAFQSYVLADYGTGPTYREAAKEDRIQKPKKENSFIILDQKENEGKDDFRARVKSAPYQYGVYVSGTGRNVVRTVMINFGDITQLNGEQKKFSDLTDNKYAASGRTVLSHDGQEEVKITQFAVEAANFSIESGFYGESHREVLEDYFTLAYGDSNVIQGQISSYSVNLSVQYSPDDLLSEKKNTALFGMHSAVDDKKDPPALPKEIKMDGTAKLTSPYGDVELDSNTALLFKYDEISHGMINGATFKLEKLEDGAWKKEKDDLVTNRLGIDGKDFEGGLKVTGLSEGTYRFVETKALPSYDPETSVDWDDKEKAVISETFTISDKNGKGSMLFVGNMPRRRASYTVEHYKETGEGTGDYELAEAETEFLDGYIGEKVVAEPKVFPKFVFDSKLEGTIKEGIVTEDGSLILKLYYKWDADAIPFTIYKSDGAWTWEDGMTGTLPSIGEKAVTFDVYRYKGWHIGNPNVPEHSPGKAPGLWELVRHDLKTDEHGRIRIEDLQLQEGGDNITFGLVETKNTYPHYHLPNQEEVYWVIWSKDGQISGIADVGTDNPGHGDFTNEDGKKHYYIKNNFVPGTFRVYKSDELGRPMPSDEDKQVAFELYEFNWSVEDTHPETEIPGKSGLWELMNNGKAFVTDEEGMILDIPLENEAYALKEVQTYPDYTIEEDSYWIVWTDKKPEKGIFISWIKYMGDNDPGVISEKDSETGFFHIKNIPKKKDFVFYKENNQGDILEDVEFALYAGHSDKTLTEDNEDPNDSETYWNMWQKFQTDSSDETGKVEFKDLTAGDYLLVETKTWPSYQLPMGQWIIHVDTAKDKIEIRGRGDPLPPAFVDIEEDDQGNIVKDYRLPNYLQTVLPSAGSWGKIALISFGAAALGVATLISITKPDKKIKKETET